MSFSSIEKLFINDCIRGTTEQRWRIRTKTCLENKQKKIAEILKGTVEILNTPATRGAEASEMSINKTLIVLTDSSSENFLVGKGEVWIF
jgi:hypothetical protein